MNYLHSPYIKSGKILNKDLLYVLWAPMSEPVRFMRLYEWREMSGMEVAALATMWKHVGDLMGIDYAAEMSRSDWTDGVDFMEDLTKWAETYEKEHLTYTHDSHKLGIVLWDLLLSAYPAFARPAGYEISMVLLGDRLRTAFGCVSPFPWTASSTDLDFITHLILDSPSRAYSGTS